MGPGAAGRIQQAGGGDFVYLLPVMSLTLRTALAQRRCSARLRNKWVGSSCWAWLSVVIPMCDGNLETGKRRSFFCVLLGL